VDWMHLAQDIILWQTCKYDNEPMNPIKGEGFLD